jgi:hypothetical protein
MQLNHQRIIVSVVAATASLFMGGCDRPTGAVGPGHADFSTKLVRDYSVYRTSAHQIMIAPEAWNSGTPTIPAKVIECAVDRHFILAKRQGLQRRSPGDPNDTYMEPAPSVFDYWILDTSSPEVYGPMTLTEFDAKKRGLGISATVALRDVESFRR